MEGSIKCLFHNSMLQAERPEHDFSFHPMPHLGLHEAALKGDILEINKLYQINPKINKLCLCNGFTPLMYAIYKNHLQAVRYIIGLGADVNMPGKLGHTPLLLASFNKNIDIITLLLDKYACINVSTVDGYTPLLCACLDNDLELIKFLVSRGADIDFSTPEFLPVPFYAISNNKIQLLEYFIENGASLNSAKMSMLHYAVFKSKKKIVKFLLDKGVNPNLVFKGYTPLHVLCGTEDNLDMLNIFTSYNADINFPDKAGKTPLLFALENGYIKIATDLIKNPLTDLKAASSGYTALHFAVSSTNVNIVKMLVEKGLEINIQTTNKKYSPLYLSLKNNNKEIAEYLIIKGADVNESLPPPHHSILKKVIWENFQPHLIELLLKNGAAINGDVRSIPLLLAVEKNLINVVNLFIKYKADINVSSPLGRSALSIAANNDFSQMCQLLIENGANLELNSPLHGAVSAGNVNVVELLLNKGANIKAKNFAGKTPLEVSLTTLNNRQINKILIENGSEYDTDESLINTNLFLQSIDYLFKAVKKNNAEKTRTLIEKGVLVNAYSKKYGTPLIYAAMKGYKETFELLANNKANINAKADNNVTALHYAAKFGNFDIVCSILKRGGYFDLKSDKGNKTALDFAIEANNNNIADLLNFITKMFNFVCKQNFTELSHLLKGAEKNNYKLYCLFNCCNSDKRSILQLASFMKAKNIYLLLKSVAPKK